MKKGFKLSEVLITLAIIGVVASLTNPAVVKNYQKTQTIAKLKKAWTTINQAYNQSQAQNGMYQTWDKGFDIGAAEYFNRYWKPYFKLQKICTSYSDCGYKSITPWKHTNGNTNTTNFVNLNSRVTFLTTDVILFVIFASGGTLVPGESVERSSIIVDLNGSKEPNVLGRDLFYFIRTNKGIMPE
jgi:prepilin-type N-terminal cleavage/methylation domain-containing protein